MEQGKEGTMDGDEWVFRSAEECDLYGPHAGHITKDRVVEDVRKAHVEMSDWDWFTCPECLFGIM